MKRFVGSLLAIVMICLGCVAGAKTRVGCFGNSITFGSCLADPLTESYPAQLQQLLGEEYEIGNFGRPGATLLRDGHNPYVKSEEFRRGLAFKPDIAIIHLGINDTDPRNWPIYGDRFAEDYHGLIDSLRSVNPSMRILVAKLSPIRATHPRFRSGTRQWLREIQEEIPRIAAANDVELINFDRPLRNRQDLLSDGIHPDKEGARLLAHEAASALTGNYGGLKLPDVYQSGMILQRDRYLPINGQSDAHRQITLTLDGRSYHTTADGQGQWSITTLPLTATGTPIEMTVSDGITTIHLNDILAGELWIASGQSNMAFRLADDRDAKEAMASAADNQMRFYNMAPIARTDTTAWTDAEIDATNRLGYFRPAKWERAEGENTGAWSAAAYYFAKELRDSLGIPVGVIHNAIGGAPIESWIDVTTLEDNMPEVLIGWLTNDYIQKWCKQRAKQNCGHRLPHARHPYEPSYLFSAAIEPLGHLPVRGTIWYQGESNAHNTMLHEQLFPLFAESWRRYFDDSKMPIVFCQLSSIDRPSWPMFRDSQRRLAKAMDHTYMAVTSDVGDSLDVHPRLKRVVGERMARQALSNVYNFYWLRAGDPEPRAAWRSGNAIIVCFDNGEDLHGADGDEIRTFEIAGPDGIFTAAKAEAIGYNQLKIYNMNTKDPRTVRYGWQAFTRGNLVNVANLPASTFMIEAKDASTEPEKGIECGVSAPFAGMLGGKVVMAGGCNFPEDPMASGAVKKFYRGIYVADPKDMQWQRIGSLPEPTAYGATAIAGNRIVMIGGTPDGYPTSCVGALTVDNNGVVQIEELPALPAPIDNAAAAAIGNIIYVAGGNYGGSPSRSLLALDLDHPENGWKKLPDMPGNPRVQPVMAVGRDAAGQEHLYLWGGFAGKHNGKEATLELDGLRYDINRNKWSRIDGPKDEAGTALATGGGIAAPLADGRIAVAGGVNKDIFLEALRNQAPDYLQHPIEWYRFNPNVLIFDPAANTWTIAATTPDAARAGAAMTVDADGNLILIGGELKPRIRTSQTLKINLK